MISQEVRKSEIEKEYAQLEKLLQTAPDEAVQRIADKVVELNKTAKNG